MKTGESKRILIVDDNKSLLMVLTDFLTFRGYEVGTAEDGEHAMEKLKTFQPDLILLDIAMPGMGGIGFLKNIMTETGQIPYRILVFTARTMTKDYFETLAIDGFVAKPCDKGDLIRKIEEILSRSPMFAKTTQSLPKAVLVGEDDPAVARTLTSLFRTAGYHIEHAETGPEVLEKAAVSRPTVIVLKQVLPRMNGNATAAVLKAMFRPQAIPVVLYDASGMGNKEDEKKYLHAGSGIEKYLITDSAVDILKATESLLRDRRSILPASGRDATAPATDGESDAKGRLASA